LKLVALSERVADLTGAPPRIFKAGRYGLGANTLAALEELCFDIDLSICPYYDFWSIGGPDFSRFNSRPAWMGSRGQVLALPTTAAPMGWLGGVSERLPSVLHSALGRRLRLNRIAARSQAFYPMRLSPEGASRA